MEIISSKRPLRGRLLEIPYHKCESSEIKKIVSIVSIVFKNNASGLGFSFSHKKDCLYCLYCL